MEPEDVREVPECAFRFLFCPYGSFLVDAGFASLFLV